MKSSTPEPGGEARRARGRQHVVRAADIVADRLGRVRRRERSRRHCGSRPARRSASALSISRCSGAMASTSGTASSSSPTRMMAPKSRQEAPAIAARGSDLQLRRRRPARPRRASAAIVGDQDRLGAGVVLGLRQEIGGDPVGIAGPVGEDQHLRRPGDHVDADLAEHQALGRRHIGIAGADDLGDRRDRLGAVGERRHRLRAADAIDFVDAGKLGRRQHQRRELAVRRRHHHHQARHAGDLGRHGIHQHRGRIGGGAARHIEADRLDRGPARAELDAERVGEAVVLRQLPAVIGLDPVAREARARRARGGRRRHGRRRSRRRVTRGRPGRDRRGRISGSARSAPGRRGRQRRR